MLTVRLVTFIVLCSFSVIGQEFVRRCYPPAGQPSCVCQTERGLINLEQIANENGILAMTVSANENESYTYSYSPCYGFDRGSQCSNVSGCQSSPSFGSFSLGVPGTEQMYTVGTDSAVLYYTGGSGGRSMYVRLHCNASVDAPVLTASGDSDHPLLYVFDLYSKCCCPGGCGDGGGLSPLEITIVAIFGTCLFILLSAVVIILIVCALRRSSKSYRTVPTENSSKYYTLVND